MNEQTRPTTVPDQLQTLSLQAGKIRAELVDGRYKLPKNTSEELRYLETTLAQISEKIEAFQREHNNMLALADVGQVINSSLELDEVLTIVMDNIVRLTKAERGFLMLRDENGEMVTRMGRNWEMESINSSEKNVSRTVVQHVLDTGEAIVTTNAQEDQRFIGQESIVAFNLRSILCVPLKVKNDIIEELKSKDVYGDFFPAELAFFAYNETIGQDNKPLTREQALAEGFRWEDEIQKTEGKETLKAEDIPDHIKDVEDSILDEVLSCIKCFRNYRLIRRELEFYRKMLIPIPRKCWNCRFTDRITRRGPYKFWNRACAKCQKEITTNYPPERADGSSVRAGSPEPIVYCEKCYQQEVY